MSSYFSRCYARNAIHNRRANRRNNNSVIVRVLIKPHKSARTKVLLQRKLSLPRRRVWISSTRQLLLLLLLLPLPMPVVLFAHLVIIVKTENSVEGCVICNYETSSFRAHTWAFGTSHEWNEWRVPKIERTSTKSRGFIRMYSPRANSASSRK